MGQGVGGWRLEIGSWRLEFEGWSLEFGCGRRWQRSPVRFASNHLCFSFSFSIFPFFHFFTFHFSFYMFHILYFIFQKYIRHEQCEFPREDV
jgi:hypothetical protein